VTDITRVAGTNWFADSGESPSLTFYTYVDKKTGAIWTVQYKGATWNYLKRYRRRGERMKKGKRW
jgi:hypothetical protein